MNSKVKLTQRETEIAELTAWGAAKKEIADRLYISVRTVENHCRSIYEKTGCSKATELSAWWFCTHFNISFGMSPFARKVAAMLLLCLHLFGEYHNVSNLLFHRPQRRATVSVSYRSRSTRRDTFKVAV